MAFDEEHLQDFDVSKSFVIWNFKRLLYILCKMLSKKKIKIALGLKVLSELKLLHDRELKEIEEKRKRKAPVFWVNPFLIKRGDHDVEIHLLKDLDWGTGTNFQNFTRIHIQQFEEILSLVKNAIAKKDTILRDAISARVRLAITLRFIATGDSYRSLEYMSRVSHKTISKFVPEVLQAIWIALQPKVPQSKVEWYKIADDFNKIWQFPHTLGAVDGKHIRIKAPAHSGSNFYCYKGYFSVILFGIVDANSKFLFIDVGSNGRINDSTIYKESPFYEALINGHLDIPSASKLPGQDIETPFFFIGDDAFPLSRHMLKPFNRNISLTVPQKVYNYRLCRARMIVECAFGRLAGRFRIFQRPIETTLETTDLIVKASCALHNFLVKENQAMNQEDEEYIPVNNFASVESQYVECDKVANTTRENIVKFLVGDGAIDSQWNKIK